MQKQKLFLIDASSYIYRAFHAIPFLSNKKGLPTNAIYGFTTMLLKVLKAFKPDHIAVVFDTKAPSFRHKLYEQYKAQRPEMPDSLKPQIPHIKDIVKAFNMPCLEMEGYEADDVIGTIAKKAKGMDVKVVIITGDKDMLQLVDDDTIVVDTMKDKTYEIKDVLERFGVAPEKVVEVMGLAGDASDNVPGVYGIGEKTASKLIKEFGTIEELLANIDKVKNKKIQESLKTNTEMARLSKGLVTINRDVPIEINYSSLVISEPDKEKLQELFREFEFMRLLNELLPQTTNNQKLTTNIILSQNELDSLVSELNPSESFAIIPKFAFSLQPLAFSHFAGLAIALKNNKSFYIPFEHHYLGAPKQLDIKNVLTCLKPVFENESIKKNTSDAKALHIIGLKNNISVKGIDFDTGIASYLLNEEGGKGSRAGTHRGTHPKDGSDGWGVREKQQNFSELDIVAAAQYACGEAVLINKLADELMPRLKEQGLLNLFHEIELPLAEVLADMEFIGIKVDKTYLEAFGRELSGMLSGIQKKIYTIAGIEFNINSPKQLADILFERLKLKPVKKTKTGYSTDEEVLTTLALSHELPQEILNYRQLSKLKSTYVDGILGLINPQTCRVHTSFNAALTATGRLSSSEPNLQNIPIRTELGRRIRAAFMPDNGWTFLSADYSQIELRIVAHLSQDEHLLNAFKNNEDVHLRTAAEVFGISPDIVTDEMRTRAKAINFGIIYGMGKYGLSKELGISQNEAGDYIDRYFSLYKGVKGYIDRTIKEAAEKGYVSTILGRRRYIPELQSEIESVRRFGERIAINTPVQGSAADLIKIAMIRIHNRLKAEGLKSRMLLQIHDELLFEVKDNEMDIITDIVRHEMENVIELTAPIKINIGTGKNWMEAG
ncbi:MAG: DNA polymerase I [Deltaproteobacteria bacterium]|nr:DNA polymerase I [Deltaproteobacteria bacterium]